MPGEIADRNVDLRFTDGSEINNHFAAGFNISGFHIVVLFNLSKEMVYIPSNTTK
jgi:hypothetical protein